MPTDAEGIDVDVLEMVHIAHVQSAPGKTFAQPRSTFTLADGSPKSTGLDGHVVIAQTVEYIPGLGQVERSLVVDTVHFLRFKDAIIYHADRVKVPLLFLYAQGDGAARFQQIEQYGVQALIHGNWFDWAIYEEEPHGWYHWRPDSVDRSLTAMSQMFDKFILGADHDVHGLMERQREGIEFRRNPTIDLWNSLVNGGP